MKPDSLMPNLRLATLLACGFAAGCTNVFFQPSRRGFYRPENFGAKYEVVYFHSGDDTLLTGLFFPAGEDGAKGTVVHFHGNGQNMTTHFLGSYWLAKASFNVFVFDYRGYGASEGKPSVEGAVSDGVAALDYVRSRPDVDPKRVVAFGQSLGAAFALAAVVRRPEGVRAVVLESPFSSFRSIARSKLKLIPVLGWLRWPLAWLLVSDRHNPSVSVERLACPLLVVHGDVDQVVPLGEGQALFGKAREPKLLWTVPGGGHTEAFTRLGFEYQERLRAYLESQTRN
ncbi:MAG: alpha/beta hydrolase [Elusimicrobia bacterium]|nr:alpha/beta hydrolase [Elusimicrobiota bacterium]